MGEDLFDTSLDNEGKFKVMATTGGVYDNKKDITIDFTIDNTMTNKIVYSSNDADVIPLPSNYYTIASNKIVIPKGSITGGVEIQLTADFFADLKQSQPIMCFLYVSLRS